MIKIKLYVLLLICYILPATLYSQGDTNFPYNLPLTTGDGLTLIQFNGKDKNGATVSLPSFTGDGMMITKDLVENSFTGAYFDDLAFSTTRGFVIEFIYEFYTYQYSRLGVMGDGFALVLFDGSLSKTQVRAGSRGSGLGYAYNRISDPNPGPAPGLTGGFLGIGFDVYGSFKAQGIAYSEDYRNGIYIGGQTMLNGFNQATSNFLTLRGPVNPITTYGKNMAGYPVLFSQNTYNESYPTSTLKNAILNPNWTYSSSSVTTSYLFQNSTIKPLKIAGGVKGVKYPNANYRRVRIEMIPDPSTSGVSYINVSVITDDALNPIKLIDKFRYNENIQINYPEVKTGATNAQSAIVGSSMSLKSPKSLKIGWMAATGQAWANIILKDASITLPYSPIVSDDAARICTRANSIGTVSPLDNDYGYEASPNPTLNPVPSQANILKSSFRFMVPNGSTYKPNSNLTTYETSKATYSYNTSTGIITARTKVAVANGTTEKVYYDVTDKFRTANDARSKVATVTFTFTDDVCSTIPIASAPTANNDFAQLCNTNLSSTSFYPLNNDIGYFISNNNQLQGIQYIDKSSFMFTSSTGGAVTVNKTATTISTSTANATYTYTFSTGQLKITTTKLVTDNLQESVYYTIKNTGGTSVSNVATIRTSFLSTNCPLAVIPPPSLRLLTTDDICKNAGTMYVIDPLVGAVGYAIVNGVQVSGIQYIDLNSFVFTETGTKNYETDYAKYTFDVSTGLIQTVVKTNTIAGSDHEFLDYSVTNKGQTARSTSGSTAVVFSGVNCTGSNLNKSGWIKINSTINRSSDHITINGMGNMPPQK